ncbi:MAG: hypothetical protein Alpg2KO_26380 [Alphaproteobacteria bacterium]
MAYYIAYLSSDLHKLTIVDHIELEVWKHVLIMEMPAIGLIILALYPVSLYFGWTDRVKNTDIGNVTVR